VSFGYGPRTVLHGVSFTLNAGQFVGLLGPNGSGKTTLLKLLSGFVSPLGGTVTLTGKTLSAFSPQELARRIAVVPQATAAAFPYRVNELIAMGLYASTKSSAHPETELVRNALSEVGMPDLYGRRYDELSGGEQRLVMIARALAQQTPVILLDEPLAALDLQHQWHVLKLLRRLQSEGRAVLATFHDLNAASQCCSHLALLENGRIVADGAPEAVLREPHLSRVYNLPLTIQTEAGLTRVDLPPV